MLLILPDCTMNFKKLFYTHFDLSRYDKDIVYFSNVIRLYWQLWQGMK